MAGFDRNGWPTSVGIGGRIASESVAALRRITHVVFSTVAEERSRVLDYGSTPWTLLKQWRVSRGPFPAMARPLQFHGGAMVVRLAVPYVTKQLFHRVPAALRQCSRHFRDLVGHHR